MARARTRPTGEDIIDQLIDGARRVFVERGFYGSRIEDICASAGLTRGAFYSRFGKKEDLFFALYDRMISEVSGLFIAGLDRAVRGDLDPIDALFQSLAEHLPIGRDWYVLNAEFTLFAIRDADAAKALAERRHALRIVIADKLGAALALSHRSATVSPELLARAVIGLVDAGLGQSLIEPEALGATTLLNTFLAPLVRHLSVAEELRESAAAPREPPGPDPKLADPTTIGIASDLAVGADTRQRLLTAAETAFLRDGYDQARLSDIATSAGISKKTIYAFAPSKAALFAAVVQAAIHREFGSDHPDRFGDGDLALTLRIHLTRYADRCFSDAAVQLYGLVMAEARHFPELARNYVDLARSGITAELAGWLESKAGQQLIAVEDSRLAAGMLIEMAIGEPLRLAALGASARPDTAEIERRVEKAVRLFLQGAGGPGLAGQLVKG